MEKDTPIVATRRKNLRKLIDDAKRNGVVSNDAEFATKYEIKGGPSFVSQLINGHSSFGDKVARRLESEINLEKWYLDRDCPEDTPFRDLKLTQVEDWDSNTPLDPDEIDVVFYKDLKFACGNGFENEALDDETRRLRISRKTLDKIGATKDQIFAATTFDRSMSPTIEDGDTVYVHMGRNQIKDGKIFAIEHGGLFRCKRLYQMPNCGVRIVSDNKDEYNEEILTIDDITKQNFRVIGWVWSWQRMDKW
ncbi:helix-turn-helix transcriptional regulator [Acinetobacter qingfengensis]|uniref:Peptidase S24/S26A/S26B/S26C domain-containing protein n=1 Tax=Acinetobacter qingfengensis TaxID=1262585 RepID=A0A1E7QYY0_9GAMM|nr:S24 family peptidase [Acinetobacter qingfengensis]KAA8731005.1 helix-turn-helix transcriptional regulator [Acinetobacter qingfengensis]OEY92216.1 hypothetical protein BJI46_05545 [Acinetobacter qingfengensis]